MSEQIPRPGGPQRWQRPDDGLLDRLDAAADRLIAEQGVPGRGAAATGAGPAPEGLPRPELDVIRIRGLHVRGFHGVHEHERREGQDFLIDAEVWLDARPAAASDDIADTVHYGHLMRALADVAEGEPVDLLETLAERLAAAVFAFPGPRAARITVHKPQAPVPLRFEDVAVSVLRFRTRAGGEAR